MSAWRPEGWTVATGMRLYKGKLLSNTREAFEAGADAMLEAVTEEIEKGLLTDEELRNLGRTSCDGSMIKLAQAIAQAQLQKILARFRSKK